MNKDEINNKLQEYARISKNIQYSTKLYAETVAPSKKPEIVLIPAKKNENEKENNIWTVVMKYTIDGIPQEVIMGIMRNAHGRKEKANAIMDFIRTQLKENANGKEGYDYYQTLCQYVKNFNIPFEFTVEGVNILANKSNQNFSTMRTYYLDNQGEMKCLYDENAVKTMVNNKQQQLLEESNRIAEIEKWNERREKILNSFDEEKRQYFIKGERITQFIQETDKNVEAQKNIVLDYLQEELEEDYNDENPKSKLLKGCLQIKEKGLSIDAKVILEDLEDKYYNGIRKKGGNVTPEEWACLDLIKEYGKFFDLVKEGRDWNARLNFLLKIKDFNVLRKIFEKSKDKELLEYLDLKEKMINEVKLAEIEVDFNKYDSAKELYEFLLHSSIRDKTKEDEKRVISSVYEHVKRLICESNFDSLELYNKYAEKSYIPVCPLPQKKQISKEKYISDIVERICENIETKGLEAPENKDYQNPNRPEQPEGR